MEDLKGDQFFVIDPAQPPRLDTFLQPIKLSIGDVNGNYLIQPGSGDLIGGLRVTSVWLKDTITINMGNGPIKITGVTFYREGGPAVFTPTDGTILESGAFKASSYVVTSTQVSIAAFGPPCFVAGTQILAPEGQRLVQTIRAGDMIITRDHGAQVVRWVGRATVNAMGRYAPIRFREGALGNARDLLVSPQHKMLISGWQAELLFGAPEVLVAAKHMVNARTIVKSPSAEVEYIHLMFDRHEIIFAEGVATESFYPGQGILASDRDMCIELMSLFPELAKAKPSWRYAAPVVSGAEAGALR